MGATRLLSPSEGANYERGLLAAPRSGPSPRPPARSTAPAALLGASSQPGSGHQKKGKEKIKTNLKKKKIPAFLGTFSFASQLFVGKGFFTMIKET